MRYLGPLTGLGYSMLSFKTRVPISSAFARLTTINDYDGVLGGWIIFPKMGIAKCRVS